MENNDNNSIPKVFLLYWSGQVISLFGSEITQFAIIWWILITYNSPLYFGLGLFAGTASGVIVQPIIGLISDWWNRKKILIGADLLQAFTTLVMILAFINSTLKFEFLFALLTLRGFFQSLHFNTNNAIIPQVVSKEQYSKLNAMNWFSFGLSNFGGPVVSALLVEFFGKENLDKVLLIDLLTFGIALIGINWMKIPNTSKATFTNSFASNITFGFKYIKGNTTLVLLLSLTVVFNFTLTTTHVIMPLFVLSPDEFNAKSTQLGLAIGFQSIGVIVASLYISLRPVKNKFAGRLVLSVFFDAIAISLIGVSLMTHNLYLLYAAQFITGIVISYYSVISSTIWQRLVPNEMLGRVNATKRIFSQGSYPMALILTGYLSEIIYPVTVVFGGVILCVFYLASLWWFSTFQSLEEEMTDSG